MGSRGFFRIKPYDNKTVLKLKGHFDSDNVRWILKAMGVSKDFPDRPMELDLDDATLDPKALKSINVNIQKLRTSGKKINLVGSNLDTSQID